MSSAATKKRFTPQEYLALERKSNAQRVLQRQDFDGEKKELKKKKNKKK